MGDQSIPTSNLKFNYSTLIYTLIPILLYIQTQFKNKKNKKDKSNLFIVCFSPPSAWFSAEEIAMHFSSPSACFSAEEIAMHFFPPSACIARTHGIGWAASAGDHAELWARPGGTVPSNPSCYGNVLRNQVDPPGDDLASGSAIIS